uniref:EC55 protein n=1 Tax=Colletotrichum higginsianum TaxID=80884 RepID=I2G7D5_9PEZI|nr:EC55 protein [Colletotrichum higginsianum]
MRFIYALQFLATRRALVSASTWATRKKPEAHRGNGRDPSIDNDILPSIGVSATHYPKHKPKGRLSADAATRRQIT